jgi:hypothetical protein
MTAPPVPAHPCRRSRPAPTAGMAATLAALATALFDQRCRGLAVAAFPAEPAHGPRGLAGNGLHRAGC